MTNEINIDGEDNIVISQVVGSEITVNKFLGDSDDYQKSVNHLNDKKKLLSRTLEDEPEERARLFKEIAELEDQLTSLRQGVINLAKTFKALEEKPEININNTRLEKAKEHFVAGRFTEARTILEQEIEAINDEGKVLLGHKAEFEDKKAEFEKEEEWYRENVAPQLEYKAYEFLILAQTVTLDFNIPIQARINRATRYFENSMEYSVFLDNLIIYSQFLWKYGNSHKAVELLKRSISLAKKNNNRSIEGICYGNLGLSYSVIGRYKEAIDCYTKGLVIAQERQDKRNESDCLGNMALAYDSLGEYEAALELQMQSLEIKREINNRIGEANSLGNLGNIYFSRGNLPKAIDLYFQALNISLELNDEDNIQSDLGNIGNTYFVFHKPAKALEFFEKSLEMARKTGNKYNESNQLDHIGLVYFSLGKYYEAIKFHQEALVIAKEIGDKCGEGTSLGNLGIAHSKLNQNSIAIKFHEQHLSIAKEIGDRQGEGTSLSNLGRTYLRLNKKERACNCWQQALTIFNSIGVPQAQTVRKWMKDAGCLEQETGDGKQET